MILVVIKNKDILTLLVRCALFEKKLNVVNTTDHILKSMEIKLGLAL